MAIWPRVPAVIAVAMPAAAAASSPPMVVTIIGRAREIQRELEKAKVHPVWAEVNRTGKLTAALVRWPWWTVVAKEEEQRRGYSLLRIRTSRDRAGISKQASSCVERHARRQHGHGGVRRWSWPAAIGRLL